MQAELCGRRSNTDFTVQPSGVAPFKEAPYRLGEIRGLRYFF